MSHLSNRTSHTLEGNIGYALLHINSHLRDEDAREGTRIFILNASKPNITNLIKCSFVAEKLKIRMDALSLYPCTVLNQVCHRNGGKYDEVGSVQFFISLLWEEQVKYNSNYGVLCVCHEKVIEYGLICPVCMSVYCGFVPICKKCKTKVSFIK